MTSLSCAYSNKTVLRNINLGNIKRGSFVVLIGPNAAGKSTLFKALSGLVRVTSGSIKLNKIDLLESSKEEWNRNVCYLPQMSANTANLTVFETILIAKKTSHSWALQDKDIADASRLISEFQLESIAHKHISQLSGGQQQLASICQALVRKPSLYLLDEPTSALDIHRELQVLHALKKQTYERNIISIVSLHNLTLAVKFADQLIVVKDGSVHAQGDTEKVLSSGVIQSAYGVEIEILRSNIGEPVITTTL